MAADDNQAEHSVEPPCMVMEATCSHEVSVEHAGKDHDSKSPGYSQEVFDLTQKGSQKASGDSKSEAHVMHFLLRARADLDVAINHYDREKRQCTGQLKWGPLNEAGPELRGLPECSRPSTLSQHDPPDPGQPALERAPPSYPFMSIMPSGTTLPERTSRYSGLSRRSEDTIDTSIAATPPRKRLQSLWRLHPGGRSSRSMEATSSLRVSTEIPRAMPSFQTNGWVRRFSMDQSPPSMSKAFSSLLAPRESLRQPKPFTKTQRVLKAVVSRTEYEILRAILMIMDACLVVWEAECAGRQALLLPTGGRVADKFELLVLQDLSLFAFLVDGLVRVVADQYDFSVRAGSGWRWYNMVTVSVHLVQVIAQHTHIGQRSVSTFRIIFSGFAAMRILRVISLVQVTASMRNLMLFRELRILVHSLVGALQSLLWCCCMGFPLIVAFGILFSEGALAFWMQEDRTADVATTALIEDFGTLLSATLSLYKSMSGGADWGEVYASLKPLGGGFCALYLMFITFSIIAFMNIATAVFVESTMRRSNNDREMMVQSELNDKREFIDSVRNIFAEFDTDCEGISKESLKKHLEDPKIGAYFTRLGVDVDHFDRLYNLLDRDQSGFIDLDEFTFGCVRLRGQAKCLDIEDLRCSIKSACETFRDGLEGLGNLSQTVTECFEFQKQDLDAALDGRLAKLETTVQDLSRDVLGLSQTLATAACPQPPVPSPPQLPMESPPKSVGSWVMPCAKELDTARVQVVPGSVDEVN